MSTEDIVRASRLLNNEIHILKDELQRTNLELESGKEKIKENQEKIKLNKQHLSKYWHVDYMAQIEIWDKLDLDDCRLGISPTLGTGEVPYECIYQDQRCHDKQGIYLKLIFIFFLQDLALYIRCLQFIVVPAETF